MSEHTFDSRRAALLEQTAAAYRKAEQIRLERLATLADLDGSGAYAYDGYTSTAAFLMHRCGMPAGEAKREVFLARALEQMPYASKLAEAGRLSVHQLEILGFARSRHPDQFTTDEATLAEAVVGLDAADTRRAVDYWAQAHDQPDETADPDPSRVYLSKTWNGRGRLDGDLDPEAHSLLSEALAGLMSEIVETTPKDELTHPSIHRAEALAELARRHLDSPDAPTDHGNRPHLTVVIDWEVLSGRRRDGLSEFLDGTVIAPEDALRLACDARVCRLLTGPDGEILDMGRQARTATPAQYRAVRLRDRHCRFPGCRRPASWCDVHHIEPWTRAGLTDLDNLVLLCRHHHTLVHRSGWRLTGTARDLMITRPDGSILPNAPP